MRTETPRSLNSPPPGPRLVEIGFASDLLRLMESPAAGPAACAAAAGALRALVNADDERSTGSKCFAHARGLAKNAGAVGALLAALRRMGAANAGAAAAVMAALKQVGARGRGLIGRTRRRLLEIGGAARAAPCGAPALPLPPLR